MRNIAMALTLLVIAIAGGGYWYLTNTAPEPEASSVPIGGPFELVDANGTTVTHQTYAGRHMLVYFGYTYCPDICPLSLQTMVEAYAQLSDTVKAELVPVFISVDPERDTAEVLRDYIAYFDPALVGLTGSVDQVENVKRTYRVYAKKAPLEDGTAADEYLVDHSSYFYLVDGKSQYVTHFGHSTTSEDMRSKIEELLG